MASKRTILVTGGAGFIGSAVCRHFLSLGTYRVINVDKITYAGNLASLAEVESSPDYRFVQADILDQTQMSQLLREEQADAVMHLAAETHVDRSIDSPAAFITTNVEGTFRLLEAALGHWSTLKPDKKRDFRFHHVSTDEVFGDLAFDGSLFSEETPYNPSSPYSASKAASDHLVQAWHRTFGLPIVLSNCSNNYGPYQFPEKLIPLVIVSALQDRPLPVYGRGENVRDWLFVDDHARALEVIISRGRVGETYLVGGRSEKNNLQVVEAICAVLDRMAPRPDGGSYASQIEFVADRPGHDRRYAIDPRKVEGELGWTPSESFESGLERTVGWYLERRDWWEPIWDAKQAGKRRGQLSAAASQDPSPTAG